jgi:hypothetical protein
VDLVLTDAKGHLFWQWRDSGGAYTTPVDLSYVGATSGPSLVAHGRNILDAFYRGKNGHLWTSWWDGTWWSAPTDLGGVGLQSAPTAVQGGPHRIDVFYIDTAGTLRDSHWDGGTWWSAPDAFSITGIKGRVGAVTNGPHHVEVFYRASNDLLMHFWSNGGPWSAPESMQKRTTSNPSGTSFLNPSLTLASLYYRDQSNHMCIIQSSKFNAWGPADCATITVGDKIVAATIDDVIYMGQTTPNGTISNATVLLEHIRGK